MSSPLELNTVADQQMGIVVASGEIDLATVPRLREAITAHLAGGLVNLLLDLSAVTFIDSTGLGVLVGAGKKAAGLGGSVQLVCDNARILRLLDITGLSKAMPVHATREAALNGGTAPAT